MAQGDASGLLVAYGKGDDRAMGLTLPMDAVRKLLIPVRPLRQSLGGFRRSNGSNSDDNVNSRILRSRSRSESRSVNGESRNELQHTSISNDGPSSRRLNASEGRPGRSWRTEMWKHHVDTLLPYRFCSLRARNQGSS